MSNENLQNLEAIENQFLQEDKGEGSLMIYAVRDLNANFSKFAAREESFSLGYDITPLDIEALYFEGIKLPRWESIKADNHEQQLEIYNQSFDKIKADFPLISRVSDTDVTVKYTAEEVARLRAECEKVSDSANDAKAIRAAQKFYIACQKAAENQMGLLLMPN
ncbi:MAG: hypothetical protein M3T96_07700 [Acidobacteriota bacterium]|nr:hypothetical protein [Acidobacteriota bacterium]